MQVKSAVRGLLSAAMFSMFAGAGLVHAQGTAYVSNQKGGISTIDLATMKVTGEFGVGGKTPRGLGVTDDGRTLIVAVRETGDIALIDTRTGKVTSRVKVGKNPEFVRVRDGMAFVSFEPTSTMGPPPKPGAKGHDDKKKGDDKKEGGHGHEGHDDDDDENKEPAQVAVVDLKQGKVIRNIVGGPETEGIEFTADGKSLVVTNEADNTLTLHDIATGRLIKQVHTEKYGARPRGIKLSPDGKTFVATLEFGNSFLVLDGQLNPLKAVPTGETPYGVAFDRKGERLFVATARAKALEVFDARTFEKIKDVPLNADRCWHFTFTPDDKQILIACGRSDAVLVIDAEKLEVTKRISDKKLPWGVVTYPRAMGSLDQP
ncbi:MAG: beta-propeller fold lactonase family protein [Gammaproteobacteria bacterium]|nr:beta-propeller fold lactonase family protein [Gammaproteobacteria bacterium]MBU0772365.1 beta-propeller fold lactonase family protein [Gammaproteobacteria bacterium]MBU0854774.1 beta-propeller fold lactonase family protein [Gammaproteobacteria bacterium]MBU1845380.1 beta-propeller fold lactonase family protein [Gammaproteobacteria bacterium]